MLGLIGFLLLVFGMIGFFKPAGDGTGFLESVGRMFGGGTPSPQQEAQDEGAEEATAARARQDVVGAYETLQRGGPQAQDQFKKFIGNAIKQLEEEIKILKKEGA